MGLWCWGNSNYNIFELLNYHGNGFPFMLQPQYPDLTSGVGTGNQIINCDFYRNYDPYTTSVKGGPWGNSDGLNVYTNLNTTTTITGCRVWNNSDDGIDTYGALGEMYVSNCWAWMNGYQPDGVTPGGDGNGYKLGIGYPDAVNAGLLGGRWINNISAYNRERGFDDSDTRTLIDFYNNTSVFNNQHGFDMYAQNIPFVFRNNIAWGNTYLGAATKQLAHVYPVNSSNNSWDPGYKVASSDFVSIDSTGISGPRQADGSLPVLRFLRLQASSPLFTGGTDLGPGFGTRMGFVYGVVPAQQ